MRLVSLTFIRDLVRGWIAPLRKMHQAAPVRTWLVLAAFIVSLGYAFVYQIQPSVDARKFHEIAVNLVTKHSFCYQCNVPLAEDSAIRDIGPGYQFFLAGVYWFFGIRLWVVWLIQAVMHAVVVWWLFGLAKRFVPEARPALLGFAVGLYAFHPDVIQQGAMLMSEALFLFLLVGLFRLVVGLFDQETGKQTLLKAGLIGLFFGALVMTRPTGLMVFVGALLLFAWKRRWKELLVVFFCFLAMETPWTLRNLHLYDKFIFNSVVGGLDIWVGLDPYGIGEFNLEKLPHITEKIQYLSPEEVEYTSFAETKKIITTMPGFAILRTLQKGFKLFALTKTSGFWLHYRGVADQLTTIVLSMLFNLAVLGMGFSAMVDVFLKRRVRHWVFATSICAILLLAIAPTISVVVNRYRIPMLPFFILLIVDWLVHVRGRDRIRSLVGAALFLAATTTVDLWGALPKVLERWRDIRSRA